MRLTAKQIPESKGLQGDLSISGKIIRVFDKKSGTSLKPGTQETLNWSFQNLVVQDETGEMTVCLKNRKEEIKKEDVDKSVTIVSTKSDKGIFGVKVEEESYIGKDSKNHTSIKVIITPAANISLDGKDNPAQTEHIEEHTVEPETKSEPADLDKIRKDTIKVTIDSYYEALGSHLEANDLKSKEVAIAIIAAAGRNADTMFIAKNGR